MFAIRQHHDILTLEKVYHIREFVFNDWKSIDLSFHSSESHRCLLLNLFSPCSKPQSNPYGAVDAEL